MLSRTEWSRLDPGARAAWADALRPAPPAADAATIVDDVRRRGDAALRELTARFDGADLADPWLDADAIGAAVVPDELERAC
jgi:histidinol dehydrogenase